MTDKKRLIATTIIRNEENNYLKPWLENMANFVDYHIFLDDASDDKTPEIIQKYLDSGYQGELHRRQTSIFRENEPKLRSELWNYTKKVAKDGDWILIVDADEFYDERLLKLKNKLFKKSFRKYGHINVSVLDMWDEYNYRCDGFWSPWHASLRIFRFIDCEFICESKSLHQKLYPEQIENTNSYHIYLPIMHHMAYLRIKDRIRRYNFYTENVDKNSISYGHALSILDKIPKLKPYRNFFDKFRKNKINVFKSIIIKKVLIVEPHPYHQEILPGFIKYFNELGYNTNLLIRKEVSNSEVFCKFPYQPNITFFKEKNIKSILLSNKIKEYDFIFFSSFEYLTDKFRGKFLDFIGFIPKTKNGILGCYHTTSFIDEFDSLGYYNDKRLFTVSGFDFKSKPTVMLASIYFGKVETKKAFNNFVRFIVVGSVTKYAKNHDLIIEATEKLLEKNINNFEIVVIGKGTINIPKKCRKNIKFFGDLDFKNMYREMEKAHYFLPLLDPTIETHKHYMNETSTGSRQLILGFLTPCIINEEFAKIYHFNESNSITYKENNLVEAMKMAINFNQSDYEKLQKNLKDLAENIYKESLTNLQTAIGYVIR